MPVRPSIDINPGSLQTFWISPLIIKVKASYRTQIQTDRDTYRHTHRDTQRHMEADTERHTGRHTDTYRQTHSHTNTYRYTEIHKTHTVTTIRLVSCFLYFVLAPPLSADSESIWPLSSCLHLFAKSHKIPRSQE